VLNQIKGVDMFTADQLVAHLVGDYILQSQWMAENKTRNSIAALTHAASYTIPFVLITRDPIALIIIIGTHFFIDRFRLARYVVWFKNGMNGPVTDTGYPEYLPKWLSTWLLIITDNTMHLLCNGVAIWLTIQL